MNEILRQDKEKLAKENQGGKSEKKEKEDGEGDEGEGDEGEDAGEEGEEDMSDNYEEYKNKEPEKKLSKSKPMGMLKALTMLRNQEEEAEAAAKEQE